MQPQGRHNDPDDKTSVVSPDMRQSPPLNDQSCLGCNHQALGHDSSPASLYDSCSPPLLLQKPVWLLHPEE